MGNSNTNKKSLVSKRSILITSTVFLIALIGTVSFLYASSGNTLPPPPLSNPQPETSKTPTPIPNESNTPIADTTTLKIPELGVEIVNIPKSLIDIIYQANPHGKVTDYTTAFFSTASLSNMDSNCSPSGTSNGVLTRVEGTYEEFLYKDHIPLLKQFDGFWLYYESPQSACSSDTDVQAANQIQVTNTRNLLINTDNIKEVE